MIKSQVQISNLTYNSENGRSGRHFGHLYHGEDLWHLPFTGSGVEQSGGSEDDAIDSAKCGEGHEHGQSPGHRTEYSVGECLKTKQNKVPMEQIKAQKVALFQ